MTLTILAYTFSSKANQCKKNNVIKIFNSTLFRFFFLNFYTKSLKFTLMLMFIEQSCDTRSLKM
jgi:hypothetical protein